MCTHRSRIVSRLYHLHCRYSATHADTGKIGAVKITRLQKSKSIVGEHRQLRHLEEEKRKEFSIYERIAGKEGIPEIYLWSNMGEWTVLIMELLSVDLMALLRFCGGKFTLQTTLRICDQMLHRLEQMHKQGVIHNDIKPLNFVVYACTFHISTLPYRNGCMHSARLPSLSRTDWRGRAWRCCVPDRLRLGYAPPREQRRRVRADRWSVPESCRHTYLLVNTVAPRRGAVLP